jgi:hypothetical protein
MDALMGGWCEIAETLPDRWSHYRRRRETKNESAGGAVSKKGWRRKIRRTRKIMRINNEQYQDWKKRKARTMQSTPVICYND